MNHLLTAKDVARELGCSLSTIYRIRTGKYPHLPPLTFIPLGRSLRIRPEAFRRWLATADAHELENAYASGFCIHYRDEDLESMAGA